jgi:hypothetical protein
MARIKELTPADIESGIYTISDLERTLGGSRLTWRKFIKQKPDIFELVKDNIKTKIYKTQYSKSELTKLYSEMKYNNMSLGLLKANRKGKF